MRVLVIAAVMWFVVGLVAQDATAQVTGLEAGSAEAQERMLEALRKIREGEIKYEKSILVKATELPKPSAEDIKMDIRFRSEQKEQAEQWVTYLLRNVPREMTSKERAARITELKEVSRRLKMGDLPIAPRMLDDEIELGKIGVIVSPRGASRSHVFDDLAMFQVFQIVSPMTMMVQRRDTIYWAEGISTEKLIDRQYIRFGDVIHVSGTTQYETVAGGSRSILKLTPYDPEPANKMLKERAGGKTKEPDTRTAEEDTRTFVDLTGKFSVTAQIVDYRDGNAVLRKEDGKMIEVPLGKLRAEDRTWIRKWLESR